MRRRKLDKRNRAKGLAYAKRLRRWHEQQNYRRGRYPLRGSGRWMF